MSQAASVPGEESVNNHWNENSDVIRDHENAAGIKNNVQQTVEQRYSDARAQLNDDSQEIAGQKEKIQDMRKNLQSEQSTAAEEHRKGFENEKASQKSLAGLNNDDLTKMAQDAQDKGTTYYGKK
ncbi:hypothetical protein GR735_16515 [Shigella sonnei]|nr:hypothetical protein [Shigella sonnei]